MGDNLHLNSMKQTKTPLNSLFFSEFNIDLLQRGIRQAFKNRSGIAIDYQNPDDLYSIMQVKYMNERVIETALKQIQTGVSQYMAYTKEIDTTRTIMDRAVNTSTVGNKLGPNNKIGIN
jgi:Fe-S cluster assembly ATPase SufC